jgi:hypothetical protein
LEPSVAVTLPDCWEHFTAKRASLSEVAISSWLAFLQADNGKKVEARIKGDQWGSFYPAQPKSVKKSGWNNQT